MRGKSYQSLSSFAESSGKKLRRLSISFRRDNAGQLHLLSLLYQKSE